MNTETHTNKLRKSSGLFFQLGLVLTLTVVYALFEHKTEVKETIPINVATNQIDPDTYFNPNVIVIERKITKSKQSQKPAEKMVDEFKVSNDPDEVETNLPFKPTDPAEGDPVDIDKDLVYVEPEDVILTDDSHLLITVQEVPIYPGCEKGDRAQKKMCFESKIRKFIRRRFNADLANQLGLSSGKKKIFVQFTITKLGEIEISNAKAPHIRLEKEGRRVVKQLPKMIPGKHNGKPVNVKYMIPISFNVK